MNIFYYIFYFYIGFFIIVNLVIWGIAIWKFRDNFSKIDVGISIYDNKKAEKLEKFVYEFPKVTEEDLVEDKRKFKELQEEFELLSAEDLNIVKKGRGRPRKNVVTEV